MKLIKILNKCQKSVFYINHINDSLSEKIRTPDRTLRRRMLYPAELLGQTAIFLPLCITVTFRTLTD